MTTQPARTQTRADEKEPRWSDFDAHLTPETLDGKSYPARIVRWAVVDVYDQKEKKSLPKPAIYLNIFTDKYLILSPTNRKRLMAAFGDRRANCVGKLITIKAEKMRVGQRDLTPIRITIPAQVDTTTGEVLDDSDASPEPVVTPIAAAPIPETAKQSAPASAQRPFPAAMVRENLRAKAGSDPAMPSPEYRSATAAALSGLVNGNDQKRRAIMQYLFGVDTGSALTVAQCRALKGWIGATKTEDGQWIPNAHTIHEVEAILTAFAIEQGQIEMPLPAPAATPTGDPVLDFWDAQPNTTGGK